MLDFVAAVQYSLLVLLDVSAVALSSASYRGRRMTLLLLSLLLLLLLLLLAPSLPLTVRVEFLVHPVSSLA